MNEPQAERADRNWEAVLVGDVTMTADVVVVVMCQARLQALGRDGTGPTRPRRAGLWKGAS
jgi:hypothetical protein